MSFNPNLPATGAPIVSAELRNQFTSLKSLIDALTEQMSPLVPVLARSAGGQWTLAFTGPEPASWHLWWRFADNETWSDSGEMSSGDFPTEDGDMAPDGAAWWQVKLVGMNGDGKQCTPFSNVISFGPVP